MAEPRSLISYHVGEYVRVKVKLAALLDSKGITRNRLQTLTGIKYEVIDRYYKEKNVEMVDLDFLAKVCYALNCKVEDIAVYVSSDEDQFL